MTSLTDTLLQQLQGPALQQVAQKLGIDEQQARSAVGNALPLLMGTLGRNAQQPQGAEALVGALQRDHADAGASGGGFDLGGLLGSVLGGGAQGARADGAGILGHIFGGQTEQATTGLAQTTGLDSGKAAQLLQALAPIVMSFLAQRFLSGSNGSADTAQVSQALGQEHAQAKASGIGGLLDQDGDGQLGVNDLMKLGSSLFGRN